MDQLDKYIQENREGLNKVENIPEEKLWNSISHKMKKVDTNLPLPKTTVPIHIWKRLSIAATILALVGWGLWFFKPEQRPVLLSDILPELAEKENYFQQLISQKEKEIRLEEIDKLLYQDVFNDLKMLDINVEQTKNDIFTFPENDRAIETLIRNYELKIRILENLNRQIEKQKYHEELEKSI